MASRCQCLTEAMSCKDWPSIAHRRQVTRDDMEDTHKSTFVRAASICAGHINSLFFPRIKRAEAVRQAYPGENHMQFQLPTTASTIGFVATPPFCRSRAF